MENTNQKEEDTVMDIESGIDSWVIDKEDRNGAHFSFDCLEETKTERKVNSSELKKMDKENIKLFKCTSDKKSLRYHEVQLKSPHSSPDPAWTKSDFLGTFKAHLISQGVAPSNITKPFASVIENSKVKDIKSVKPPLTNQNTFKCKLCNYYCSELLIHKSHEILFHSDKKVLDCEYCDFQTTQCANLATHIRLHFQLDCPHCDYQCSQKTSLESHLIMYHPEANTYKCKKCDYKCKSRSIFQKHLQLHTGSSGYQCGACKMFFANKQVLKRHIKTHSAARKRFKCNKCELCFSQRNNLKHHMRAHEQYICSSCNSTFTKKRFLKVHMKMHTNDILKCDKCDATFSRKNHLKLHMRIHFLKCKHCSFQCSDSNDFAKHICIKKLYEVQERSLNFNKPSKDNVRIKQVKNDKEKKDDTMVSILEGSKTKDLKLRNVNTEGEFSVQSLLKKKRCRKNKLLLSLRQNVPSRNCQKPAESVTRDAERRPRNLKKDSSNLVQDVVKCDKSQMRATRKNGAYKSDVKQSPWLSNKDDIYTKKQKKWARKIKKDDLSRCLSCTNILFLKNLSPKELFIEQVTFVNGTYVQCFYQSQQTTAPEHLERHISQNTLLSCRLCKYKTNSTQLLQHHTAKHHTWDPTVVNMLFS